MSTDFKGIECIPYAPALVESMRSMGYSFSSAIADIIDNSISAGAKRIDVYSPPKHDYERFLIILDDGCGMDESCLYEAMRYGSSNPNDVRGKNDLGRFGLGLKSASLSQCKKLTVVSKQKENFCAYVWDIDYIIATQKWMLKKLSVEEMEKLPGISKLKENETGTYVLLQQFDRIENSTKRFTDTFSKNLIDMKNHLALVFHRFIEPDDGSATTEIYLNNAKIEARDPFLITNPATQSFEEQQICVPNATGNDVIKLKAFALPHISKLTNDDIAKLGGKDNLRNEQGFYVYRGKRLIIWATWFRLENKDEFGKYARIRVDIPNSLDYMWKIDIKKSTASLPDSLKDTLIKVLRKAVPASQNIVHGPVVKQNNSDIVAVWQRTENEERTECKYSVNRAIPQIKLLKATLDKEQQKMLQEVIHAIENNLPIGALYRDVAKGTLNDREKEVEKSEIEKMWSEIQAMLCFAKDKGVSLTALCSALKDTEPYCRYQDVKQRLEEYENE